MSKDSGSAGGPGGEKMLEFLQKVEESHEQIERLADHFAGQKATNNGVFAVCMGLMMRIILNGRAWPNGSNILSRCFTVLSSMASLMKGIVRMLPITHPAPNVGLSPNLGSNRGADGRYELDGFQLSCQKLPVAYISITDNLLSAGAVEMCGPGLSPMFRGVSFAEAVIAEWAIKHPFVSMPTRLEFLRSMTDMDKVLISEKLSDMVNHFIHKSSIETETENDSDANSPTFRASASLMIDAAAIAETLDIVLTSYRPDVAKASLALGVLCSKTIMFDVRDKHGQLDYSLIRQARDAFVLALDQCLNARVAFESDMLPCQASQDQFQKSTAKPGDPEMN